MKTVLLCACLVLFCSGCVEVPSGLIESFEVLSVEEDKKSGEKLGKEEAAKLSKALADGSEKDISGCVKNANRWLQSVVKCFQEPEVCGHHDIVCAHAALELIHSLKESERTSFRKWIDDHKDDENCAALLRTLEPIEKAVAELQGNSSSKQSDSKK